MATNKEILNRGLKYIVWALPLFFIGPTVIMSSFKNTGHPFFIPVLGLGIIISTLSVILLFRGLVTIMKSQSDQ
ncbi:MAG: hypothetical protein EOO48_08605 [Flavobacterium sp.]|nr:MAG: hypothetical protein EOO48_08605 [Flavobacterium sp.]